MARRRRRQRNPLIMRILAVVLAAHAIALPIAAHFGALDSLKKEFGASRVVVINVPAVEEPKKKAPEKPKKAPKTAPAKKAASSVPKPTAAEKTNIPQPKVVASTGPGAAGGGGPTVNPNGTGVAGAPPVPPTPPGGGAKPKEPEPHPAPPATEPKPESNPETKPEPKPDAPVNPAPPKPLAAPAAKRIVQARPEYAPEPQIPDDLRSEPFEKALVVEADVDTGGHPINVRIAASTGTKELDEIGLDTARRYRFKPATVNEDPVQEHVRFRIIFKVE